MRGLVTVNRDIYPSGAVLNCWATLPADWYRSLSTYSVIYKLYIGIVLADNHHHFVSMIWKDFQNSETKLLSCAALITLYPSSSLLAILRYVKSFTEFAVLHSLELTENVFNRTFYISFYFKLSLRSVLYAVCLSSHHLWRLSPDICIRITILQNWVYIVLITRGHIK